MNELLGLIVMLYTKKRYQSLAVVAALSLIGVIVYEHFYKSTPSNAVSQTATVSGVGNATQISGNSNNVYNGVAQSTLDKEIANTHAAFNMKDAELLRRLGNEFSRGFAIFGWPGGDFKMESHWKDWVCSANWDTLAVEIKTNTVFLQLDNVVIYNPKTNNRLQNDMKETWNLVENPTYESHVFYFPGMPNIYYRVLEVESRMILIGFK